MMEFDFLTLGKDDRYRLLCSFVAPRPIALVTTVSADGRPNGAPMSFFNVFSHEPPLLVLGIQTRPDGSPKDTLRNLRDTGEFVVNMVDRAIGQLMVECGVAYPAGVDEITRSGLHWERSAVVSPGRVQESPCAMECRLERSIEFDRRSIVIGEVVYMHVRDDCIDADGVDVIAKNYAPLARLHGDNYIEATEQFELHPLEALGFGEHG
jgi:flavin reductase (DIM6/NTAB) family NADH-FMN oxidoreductase RutF